MYKSEQVHDISVGHSIYVSLQIGLQLHFLLIANDYMWET